MQMVQNGQIPDDVKSINDKPLDPNYKVERGQRQAPLKVALRCRSRDFFQPWQKSTAVSETTVSTPDSSPRVEEIVDDKKEEPQTL